jgi:hypothetical protein
MSTQSSLRRINTHFRVTEVRCVFAAIRGMEYAFLLAIWSNHLRSDVRSSTFTISSLIYPCCSTGKVDKKVYALM